MVIITVTIVAIIIFITVNSREKVTNFIVVLHYYWHCFMRFYLLDFVDLTTAMNSKGLSSLIFYWQYLNQFNILVTILPVNLMSFRLHYWYYHQSSSVQHFTLANVIAYYFKVVQSEALIEKVFNKVISQVSNFFTLWKLQSYYYCAICQYCCCYHLMLMISLYYSMMTVPNYSVVSFHQW